CGALRHFPVYTDADNGGVLLLHQVSKARQTLQRIGRGGCGACVERSGLRKGTCRAHAEGDNARHCERPRRAALRDLSTGPRSEEHTSELQSRENLVCRLLLEKKQSL